MGKDGTLSELMRQGVAAAKAGDRNQARQIFLQAVERDRSNEHAWLWLAGVTDAPEEIRACLEHVLQINPQNQHAQRGLAWLEATYPAAQERAVGEPQTYAATSSSALLERAVGEPQVSVQTNSIPLERAVGETAPYPASRTEPRERVANSPTATPPSPATPKLIATLPRVDGIPCPYCGHATQLRDRRCDTCQRSLMQRTELATTPSFLLSTLVALWNLDALATAALGVFGILVGLWYAQETGQWSLATALPWTLPGFGILLLALIRRMLAKSLALRQQGILAAGVLFCGALLVAAVGAWVFGQEPIRLASATLMTNLNLPREIANGLALAFPAAMLIIAGAQVFYLFLLALTARDFFPHYERFVPEVVATDAATHYNNGIDYRKQGMWYLATREWEEAVLRRPRDITYLHALGLAYAQLGEFERAMATLERGLLIDPQHIGLRESRAMVGRQLGT